MAGHGTASEQQEAMPWPDPAPLKRAALAGPRRGA